MIKNIIIGLAAAAALSACATTTGGTSLNSAEKAEARKLVDGLVSDIADNISGVDAAGALDCKMASSMVGMVLADSGGDDLKLVTGVSVSVWGEVYRRQTNPETANLDDILAKGKIMEAIDSDEISADEGAELVAEIHMDCTEKLTTALEAASAAQKAEQETAAAVGNVIGVLNN